MQGDFKSDLQIIANTKFIDWSRFAGKTFFVTGATGLIGHMLVSALLYANRVGMLNLKVLALVRDEARARSRFSDFEEDMGGALRLVCGSVEDSAVIDGIEEGVDYVVHGASQTSSKGFVEQPVETIVTALNGTENVLGLAKKKAAEGFVYLSSMEVYGYPQKGHKVREDEIGRFVPQDVRNSYPLSKVQCESLCCAYAKEYGVPARILRLTQTFDSNVNHDDKRIVAYFKQCVEAKRNIVLKTKGETERSYLYVGDAATAILLLLQRGKDGASYNVADESTYCSIAQMAERIAEKNGIGVEYDIQDVAKNGFLNTLYMDLDTSALRGLGWEVQFFNKIKS